MPSVSSAASAAEAPAPSLPRRRTSALALQRAVARAAAPLWVPAFPLAMRLVLGWRLVGAAEVRATYARLKAEDERPLLVCANHLTMVDSFLVAWALASPWTYLRRFSWLAWNVPERRNFAASRLGRIGVYLAKCVPIVRGGDRREVAGVLASLAYLLARGETVLIFPEGGRSRSGRVEAESAAYGVGRLVGDVEGCRVLCVYVRGRGQRTWSTLPRRGEVFDVVTEVYEPTTKGRGLRAAVEISRGIVAKLAEMEARVHGRSR